MLVKLCVATMIVVATTTFEIAPVFGQAGSCDRACLEQLADRYLQALVAHDTSRAPLAADIKFAENGIALRLDQGLWKTSTGLGKYRHFFADTRDGQVGLITTIQLNGKDQILALRLKTDAGKISEAEHLVINDSMSASFYDKFKLDPLWLQETPPAERVSREVLIATANKYYTGMQRNDPKGDYSFFHKDCNRIEHTRQTTNMPPSNYGHSNNANFVTLGCEDQFKTGFLGFVTRIRDRRFAVVDEERQAVLAFGFFDHNGTIRDIPLSTGESFHIPPYFSTPRTLEIAEGFKIKDGKIRLIEALLTESPYGMRSAFDAPLRTAPISGPCDRACLNSLVDQVLKAMMARDSSLVPLAPNARYTENGQELALNDGLWGTLTARGGYSLYLPDTRKSQAGFMGSTVETDIPGMLTVRLKQERGLITEIEAICVRQEKPLNGKLIGTRTMMGPQWLTDFDSNGFTQADPALTAPLGPGDSTDASQMTHAVNRYLDALQSGKSAAAPIAGNCNIRINGVQATDNPAAQAIDQAHPDFRPHSLGCVAQIDSGLMAAVSRIRARRVLVVDPTQGLLLAVVEIDHPADTLQIKLPKIGVIASPPALRIPTTYLTTMLFKIRRGRIAQIEQIERPSFYGINSGWPK